ncbi:MAG: efflux RND transporter periplasmic adaptor subunit [Gammaproteobacteria bacterium]|nr:efflux RND transporter periplasmic adaptor subunit [Gammaproteobacteria bacterium]
MRNKMRGWIIVCGISAGLLVFTPATAVELDAKLVWHRKAVLSTPVSGVITEINVSVGTLVAKDDVLLKLDDRFLKANVEQAKASVVRWHRIQQEAKRELDRSLELYDRTLLSDHDREVAHIQYDQAMSDFKSAQASLVHAELAFEYSAIRAPFDGVVVRQYAEVGETIVSEQSARPLVELAEHGHMAVNVLVSGERSKRLKIGSFAKVKVDGVSYQGQVVAVGLELVSAAVQKYEINIVFHTQGKLMRAGQPAKVSLP